MADIKSHERPERTITSNENQGGGGLLDFWNERANVLIWGLQFKTGKIIWGLKFGGAQCAICALKFEVEEIIWGLCVTAQVIFLVSSFFGN